jgi:osmoprotectant transport system substrate-binding protein
LVPLQPAPAQDVNVLVVTRLSAADLGLATISDLATVADGFTIGGPVECPDRPLCLVGLRDVYGLEFAGFVPQRSMAVTAEALRRYEIDVGVMFSTAPEVDEGRLTVLADDRRLQPAENVLPLVRAATIEQWGTRLVDALNGLSSALTTEDLRTLNGEVGDGKPIESAVADWMRSAGAG